MTREEKNQEIDFLQAKFNENDTFYIADASTLNVAEINELRALCYQQGVTLRVAKNTLITKALEKIDEDDRYKQVYEMLVGPTSIMFSEVSNAPAKILKEFRKKHDKPVLKGAYIDSAIYVGDEQIETLSKLKSKEELIGEVIALLQSPAKNVISALQYGGQTISGILKTLSDRTEE